MRDDSHSQAHSYDGRDKNSNAMHTRTTVVYEGEITMSKCNTEAAILWDDNLHVLMRKH